MIEQIRIRGFKSLADVTVDLPPVTVLIGKSGSGKSSFMEAIRFLRDALVTRNLDQAAKDHGGWINVFTITQNAPRVISFRVSFRIEDIDEPFCYELTAQQANERHHAGMPPAVLAEELRFGTKVLFRHERGKWTTLPNVAATPNAAGIILGAITGFQESSLAYGALTHGLGCYRFADQVLEARPQQPHHARNGLDDTGANFVAAFADIFQDFKHYKSLKQLEAAMRTMKPTLLSMTVDEPAKTAVTTAHEIAGRPRIVFDIGRESEGFRRLFVCLLALYQRPPKQTLLFDEPEKGIYPAALELLAEEFMACAQSGRGQVILTTHSPDFLDHFQPDQIRVVAMENFETRIGPIHEGQVEAIREQFLRPGELLTVDQARLIGADAAETAQ